MEEVKSSNGMSSLTPASFWGDDNYSWRTASTVKYVEVSYQHVEIIK